MDIAIVFDGGTAEPSIDVGQQIPWPVRPVRQPVVLTRDHDHVVRRHRDRLNRVVDEGQIRAEQGRDCRKQSSLSVADGDEGDLLRCRGGVGIVAEPPHDLVYHEGAARQTDRDLGATGCADLCVQIVGSLFHPFAQVPQVGGPRDVDERVAAYVVSVAQNGFHHGLIQGLPARATDLKDGRRRCGGIEWRAGRGGRPGDAGGVGRDYHRSGDRKCR